MNELFAIVDVETARAARGVRLVVLGAGPSLWSEAAKALFRVKGLPALWVRQAPGDEASRQWTGWHNAPVAFYEDEPPRTHWSDIVMLAERLGGLCSLVPSDADERALMFGLIHEISGEGGLGWCARTLAIAASSSSGGARSFPERVGKYLGRKYGKDGRTALQARQHLVTVLARLAELLRRRHLHGDHTFLPHGLSALDLHAAAATWMLAPPTEDSCPMAPPMRAAAQYLAEELGDEMPAILIAHRDFVYERYLSLPLVF